MATYQSRTPIGRPSASVANTAPTLPTTQPSTGFSIYPSVVALDMALRIIKTKRTWEPKTPGNRSGIMWSIVFDGLTGKPLPFNDEELVAIAALTAEDINRFMEAKGYPEIKLEHFSPGSFGVASIMNVVVLWPQAHEESFMRIPVDGGSQSFPSVKIRRDYSLLESSRHPHPIIQLDTQNGDLVYLTKATTSLAGLDLLQHITGLQQTLYTSYANYSGVEFPMASFRAQTDVSFLLDLHTYGADGVERDIRQAKQVDVFEMDNIGARAGAGFAAEVRTRGISHGPYQLDAPFWAWIKRPNLDIPIGAYFISQDAWKRPTR